MIKKIILILNMIFLYMIIGCTSKPSEKYLYSEDFEYNTMDEAKENILKSWNIEQYDSWGKSTEIINENGNKFLRMQWIEGRLLKSNKVFYTPYTFEGKFKVDTVGAPGGFVFLKTTFSTYTAELYSGATQGINEYESDGYDDGAYTYGVGASGVYIKFGSSLFCMGK